MTQETKDKLKKYQGIKSDNKIVRTRFNKTRKWNAGFSSYVCFFLAIMEQKYSRSTIMKWFNKLVNKDDYAQNEKRGIVNYLYECNRKKFAK